MKGSIAREAVPFQKITLGPDGNATPSAFKVRKMKCMRRNFIDKRTPEQEVPERLTAHGVNLFP